MNLIHCITNYVTVNDVANIILASKSSPVMSDDIDEVKEIQSISSGLLINIGTLNKRTIESMFAACKQANKLKHPIVLDCVGNGASKLRTSTINKLLKEVKFDVIKGNASEILTILKQDTKTSGVDSTINLDIKSLVTCAKKLASKYHCVIAITGKVDVISNNKKTYLCYNGSSKMGRITGCGCMLGGVIASYVCSNLDNKLKATLDAITAFNIAGERADKQSKGLGSFHINLINEMGNIKDIDIKKYAKVK
ncbi:MAG: hydroxyethylthiazole kinase [Malacoplasma sp.]|nr:hydroxyethylthiazole kinase [Malacoplasma sp.]